MVCTCTMTRTTEPQVPNRLIIKMKERASVEIEEQMIKLILILIEIVLHMATVLFDQ